jgi:preprotein translocase subunit SecE
MGKIQRKKGPAAKKKKKEKAAAKAASQLQVAGRNSGKKAASSGTGSKALEKKQALPQKKVQTTPSAPAVKAKPNFIDVTMQFLREVKVELKKVTWPSRKQTIGSTVVVLALVILISLFLGVVDVGLSQMIKFVLQQ